jgi:prepilin-type N-terminal cleavage/methylation domain-containing protein
MKRQNRKQTGFTFIDMVIVIVVIGILASIAVTRYAPLQQSAKRATCLANQKALEEAQRLYFSNESINNGKGAFAQTIEELVPIMQNDVLPSCPDGFAYELLPEGRIRCTSPDHQR